MIVWEIILSLLLIPVALVDYLIQIPVNFPQMPAIINGENFTLYTAKNFTQWQQGFKGWFVKNDEAMLFEFSKTTTKYFWMKGTNTPLDIIFLDENFRVTNVAENAKPCKVFCKNYSGRAKYVLELRGGVAKKLGITYNSVVSLEKKR